MHVLLAAGPSRAVRWPVCGRVETYGIFLCTSLLQAFLQVVRLTVLLVLGDRDGYRPLELLLSSLNVDSRGCSRAEAPNATTDEARVVHESSMAAHHHLLHERGLAAD